MAQNPWSKNGLPQQQVPRSYRDLSFQNNLTFNYGQLIPALCLPVFPGMEVSIDTTAGFRFLPTAFPVQTRQRARIEYFYVRNRNLWKDWPDFIGKTMKSSALPCPYPSLDNVRNPDMFGTGSLGDYLGLPSVLYGSYGLTYPLVANSFFMFLKDTPSSTRKSFYAGSSVPAGSYHAILNSYEAVAASTSASLTASYSDLLNNSGFTPAGYTGVFIGNFFTRSLNAPSYEVRLEPFTPASGNPVPAGVFMFDSKTKEIYIYNYLSAPNRDLTYSEEFNFVAEDESGFTVKFNMDSAGASTFRVLGGSDVSGVPGNRFNFGIVSYQSRPSALVFPSSSGTYTELTTKPIEAVQEKSVTLPWAQSENGSPINMFRFRAYESIYNAFYRDERNNPYILKGEKEYNKYLPTTDGGPDPFVYGIHYRNWEQDMFTTAVPTPQQGVAPLVGITSTGKATFADPETGKEYIAQATFADDDASTITGFTMTENVPNSVARALVDTAASGISINDLRNVNAWQKWLETNIRRGYKYRDIIKSHFDVDVSFAELDMPEFLGGTSFDVSPVTIDQTSQESSADNSHSPLGSYAGQLYASGGSRNKVHKFFDEHGYLMAIVSIVPVPVYTQQMDKDWFKGQDAFDYYWPEFANIGLQPILTRELAALQLINSGISPEEFATDTFGYQRPWYEYQGKLDEAHGLFRTELSNFILNRTFDVKPTLGEDFLLVRPKELSDIFTVTDISHKIFGQLYFTMDVKLPMPENSVPRLD